MSKKLLEESTIRSFMKLANLQPLTDKFIKENWEQKEGQLDEEDKKDEEDEEHKKKSGKDEEVMEEGELEEETLEEEVVEEGDDLEEGKESEGRPASPKQAVKGVAKPGKMDAAKNAAGDAKLKPMKQTHVHSDKPDSIEHNKKSNAPKKNNAQFDVVAESLQEMDGMKDEASDAPESPEMAGGDDMGSAGESGDHQEKMKGLIRQMLENLKEMGAEYGMSMEISDEGEAAEAPAPEAPAGAEGEEMMQEKLDEMVEKLTKRVAARLVKETKKKN
jgi:hypothetical protein